MIDGKVRCVGWPELYIHFQCIALYIGRLYIYGLLCAGVGVCHVESEMYGAHCRTEVEPRLSMVKVISTGSSPSAVDTLMYPMSPFTSGEVRDSPSEPSSASARLRVLEPDEVCAVAFAGIVEVVAFFIEVAHLVEVHVGGRRYKPTGPE